ncbi:hypothetical protein [Companilactobacillus mishanensis]|uniref:DUF3450 domain-containing protein n=1 Tax=Companilactobacillus mishanensis TaxID=2486008 RepID=A0A5P0ZGQ9_9LACO|nr:hypothetical protein [Companilactobacillus mishanensis]MQS52182.1 DUF3450 domain-containing protein [Companilactobacillus mishanensis]
MNDTFLALLSAVGGGAITGLTGVWGLHVKNRGSNEQVYAEHTDELFDRLDKITSERDDLKEQVIKLTAKVNEQTKVIDQLNKQMGELNIKFDRLEE